MCRHLTRKHRAYAFTVTTDQKAGDPIQPRGFSRPAPARSVRQGHRRTQKKNMTKKKKKLCKHNKPPWPVGAPESTLAIGRRRLTNCSRPWEIRGWRSQAWVKRRSRRRVNRSAVKNKGEKKTIC